MGTVRSIARNIMRGRLERAMIVRKFCPVCSGVMKDVWYSRNAKKCCKCKTVVKVPASFFRNLFI